MANEQRAPSGARRPYTWTTRPGLYYCLSARSWFGFSWRGPVYYRNSRWRGDLHDVLIQLQAIVRTNGSLTDGLEAAAHEERRLLNTVTMRSIGGAFRALAISGGLFATLCFVLGLASYFYMSSGMFASDMPYGMPPMPPPPYFYAKLGLAYGLALFVPLYARYHSGIREALFLRMRNSIANGLALSETMRALRRFFPAHYADLVAAAEDSGCMEKALEQLAKDTRDAVGQESSIQRHKFYLLGLLAAQGFLIKFLVRPVKNGYPSIASKEETLPRGILGGNAGLGLPRDYGFDLPEATSRLVSFLETVSSGEFPFTWAGLGVALAVLGAAYGLSRRFRKRFLFGRPIAGTAAGLFPGLRAHFRRRNEGLIASLLDKLLSVSTPLPQALASAAQADLHRSYRRALGRVRGRIEQGSSFADALDNEGRVFSEDFRSLVRMGEHSGLVHEALRRLGERYEMRTRRFTHMVQNVLLPVGVVAVGTLGLLVAVAILRFHLERLATYNYWYF